MISTTSKNAEINSLGMYYPAVSVRQSGPQGPVCFISHPCMELSMSSSSLMSRSFFL